MLILNEQVNEINGFLLNSVPNLDFFLQDVNMHFRVLLIQDIAARIKANERQHLIQANVSQYFDFRFSDNSSAILLYATVASLPRPPVVEKIKGVKEPCSISLILSPYSLFFICS